MSVAREARVILLVHFKNYKKTHHFILSHADSISLLISIITSDSIKLCPSSISFDFTAQSCTQVYAYNYWLFSSINT